MSRKSDREATLIFIFIAAIIAIIYYIVKWVSENAAAVILVILTVGIIFGVYYFIKNRKEKREKQEYIELQERKKKFEEENEKLEIERNIKLAQEKQKLEEERKIKLSAEMEKFEVEQKEKGLIKFSDRNNNINWGTFEETEKWKKDDEEAKNKDLLINRIVQSIQNYQPIKKWSDEDSYHKELLGYLRVEFPDIKYEFQKGSSRPDLVIGNIAIEIKGPTDNNALDTLTTKCLKYSHHFDHLIMILFDPQFSERHFREIESGIHQYFPHVVIIRK